MTEILSEPRPPSVTEMVIEGFASENAELRELLEAQQANLAIYRELLVATMDSLRHLTLHLRLSKEQRCRIVDQYRALRMHVLGGDIGAKNRRGVTPPPARSPRPLRRPAQSGPASNKQALH